MILQLHTHMTIIVTTNGLLLVLCISCVQNVKLLVAKHIFNKQLDHATDRQQSLKIKPSYL